MRNFELSSGSVVDDSSRSHRVDRSRSAFTTRKLTRLTKRCCADQRLANQLASNWSPLFAKRTGRGSRTSRRRAIVRTLEARSFTRTLSGDLTVSKDFIHEFSHHWRSTLVVEARTSDVIASRRLASDWLDGDITWKCVTIAQARHSNLKGDARISSLPRFPPFTTEFLRFHHLRSSSLFLLLSIPLSIVPYTLSPSRSIAFCVVSTLVRLSPILPLSIFLFLLSSNIFPSRFLARVRRLFCGFFSTTSFLPSRSPL